MQSDPVRSLLDRLCPQTRKDTLSAWRRAWIAGDAVLEMERKRLLEEMCYVFFVEAVTFRVLLILLVHIALGLVLIY